MKNLSFIYFILVLSGCTSMTQMVGTVSGDKVVAEKATEELTPQQEYYLGRSVAAKILAQKERHPKNDVQTYLGTMGHYLAYHSQRPETFSGYQFAVVKDKTPSAMSAPGGFIFMTDGMIQSLDNEDELAAVLAHEIAHIELRHAESIIREKNMNQFWQKKLSQGLGLGLKLTGKGDTPVASLTESAINAGSKLVEQLLTINFDKEQEMEADQRALNILKSSGYDAFSLLDVLQKTKDSKNDRHPSSQKRIEALEKELNGLSRSAKTEAREQRLNKIKQSL